MKEHSKEYMEVWNFMKELSKNSDEQFKKFA